MNYIGTVMIKYYPGKKKVVASLRPAGKASDSTVSVYEHMNAVSPNVNSLDFKKVGAFEPEVSWGEK